MEFTAAQIAAMAGGVVEGNADVKVNTFAKIEEGHDGALSFLANPKYSKHIYTTGASAVLVSRDFVAEDYISTTLIRVDDPYATLAALMRELSRILNPPRRGVSTKASVAADVTLPDDAYVGDFAVVESGVTIGAGVQIYPHSFIGAGAAIGADTIIYPHVTVYHGCRIGARCIVHAGAVIGADGFGFAPAPDGHYDKLPQLGIVEIGDDVEIGANTTIDRATMGATRVGRGVKVDNLVQLAHNTLVDANTVIAAQVGVAGSTKIGKQCMIGGQAGFAGHITVGNGVQIGAQSGIPSNVGDGSRIMGYPAVDAHMFARQAAAVKQLPEFMRQVRAALDDTNKN